MHHVDKPFVAVTWDDAHASATGDYTDEEIAQAKPWQFTTYGFLLRSDNAMVAISGEIGEDKKYRAVSFIPRSLVKEIVELAGPKQKKGKRREQRNRGTEEAA